ncbi:hypothetical protein OROMI_015713 [Orobanche minor]
MGDDKVYKKAYSFGLPAINGERMWPKVVGNLVEPPLIRKMPGRPKKKRRRDQDEKDPQNPHRLRKVGVQMTCQRCFQIGQNSRSCKNEAVQKPHKEPGKIGRPRKHLSTESSSRRPTNPQQTSQSEAQALKKVLAKERALAEKGIGRLVCERTRNAYIHMSSDSTIYYAPGASRVSSSATTSSTDVGISTTQESQAK